MTTAFESVDVAGRCAHLDQVSAQRAGSVQTRQRVERIARLSRGAFEWLEQPQQPSQVRAVFGDGIRGVEQPQHGFARGELRVVRARRPSKGVDHAPFGEHVGLHDEPASAARVDPPPYDSAATGHFDSQHSSRRPVLLPSAPPVRVAAPWPTESRTWPSEHAFDPTTKPERRRAANFPNGLRAKSVMGLHWARVDLDRILRHEQKHRRSASIAHSWRRLARTPSPERDHSRVGQQAFTMSKHMIIQQQGGRLQAARFACCSVLS